MHTDILKFFKRVLDCDSEILRLINSCQDQVFLEHDSQCLIFSLPALHQIVTLDQQLSYHQFRKMLYQGSLNDDLKSLGGKIELHESNKTVDDSLYKLNQI